MLGNGVLEMKPWLPSVIVEQTADFRPSVTHWIGFVKVCVSLRRTILHTETTPG